MRRAAGRAVVFITLIGSVLVPGRAALANDLCNTTFNVPGVYTMLHDHTCPAGTAITISADGVTFDLGGFRLSGQGLGAVGIHVSFAADGVVIRNGTVRGFDVGIEAGGTAGGQCFVGDSEDLTIDDVTVRNSVDYGMWLCASGNSTVTDSAVINTTDQFGTGLHAARGVDVESSSVTDSAGYGVTLVAGDVFDDVALRDSTVENSGPRGINIEGLGDGQIEVADSTVTECSAVSCRGIFARGEAHVDIIRTTVQDVDFGIDGGTNQFHSFAITDSLVRRVAQDGISLYNIFLPVIEGTVVRGVGSFASPGFEDAGIRMSCTITAAILDSRVLFTEGDGIVVDEDTGVACAGGSDATLIEHTVVAGSTLNGIVLSDAPDYLLVEDALLGNGGHGVVVEANAPSSNIFGTLSRANGGDGFRLDTADVNLDENRAARNGAYGYETVGPVAFDGGNFGSGNALGLCSDPADLPNTCLAPPPPPAGIALNGSAVTGSTDSATSIVLPAWTPAANDLVLVAVTTRDETVPVSVAGNGLTWTQVADVDNVQGQGGVVLFRGQGASPTAGSITVTLTGNAQAAVAVAQRFSGVDATTPVEAVVTNAGPATDDDDMFDSVTTLTPGAFAVAASSQRIAQLTLPAGEVAIAVNQQAGTSTMYGSLWYQGPVDPPAATQLGESNDLDNTNDWALVLVSLKPA